MFSRKRAARREVLAGEVYQHVRDGKAVEIARVIGVEDDRDGIAHVRYELSYRRSHQVDFEGMRILALESFVRHFGMLVHTGDESVAASSRPGERSPW